MNLLAHITLVKILSHIQFFFFHLFNSTCQKSIQNSSLTVLFFQYLKIFHHFLLTSMIFDEQFTVIQVFVLQAIPFFSVSKIQFSKFHYDIYVFWGTLFCSGFILIQSVSLCLVLSFSVVFCLSNLGSFQPLLFKSHPLLSLSTLITQRLIFCYSPHGTEAISFFFFFFFQSSFSSLFSLKNFYKSIKLKIYFL